MTPEDVIQRMVETEPSVGSGALVVTYATALAELERMLSDREMQVLVEAGAQFVRMVYPEKFATVKI
ncbi:hypothetical protein BLA3211_08406 [Burkholderia aenigmatica]|uniref:Uncharacterized protein n=1 Tax=Burkholderia aenigmatica TaxID=2015348 RepID=A0A6J5JUH5_9BURK|nr:hypothetical protein [Burkholderia aenigmatica]CAB3975269.1 hypothetical protein BLA3211_08406 [Burkholderia aenigmatica]